MLVRLEAASSGPQIVAALLESSVVQVIDLQNPPWEVIHPLAQIDVWSQLGKDPLLQPGRRGFSITNMHHDGVFLAHGPTV